MNQNLFDIQSKMLVYRAKHNISQDEFAKLCHISKQTVCYVENGKQKPSKITIQKILNVVDN